MSLSTAPTAWPEAPDAATEPTSQCTTPPRGGLRADVVPEVGPGLRVKAGGGFVEDDQAGLVDQAHRNVQTPPLAS